MRSLSELTAGMTLVVCASERQSLNLHAQLPCGARIERATYLNQQTRKKVVISIISSY